MKKLVSMLIAVIMLLGAMPALAAPMPYVVLSEFNDGELTGVVVKPNEKFSGDFTLIAALCKDDTVLEVKTRAKSQLGSGREISFDAVEGSEIKLFAWDSLTTLQPAKEDFVSRLSYDEVMSQLKKANDYWIGQNLTVYDETNPWDVAVFHTGNMQAYYMTGDEAYRSYSTLWSDVHSWQSHQYPVGSITNADNICCFQTYIDLYNMDKNEEYLECVKEVVDKTTQSANVTYWDWVDTFYMAAPVFTKMYELTGDRAYLDKMYDMIRYTADNLECYDEEEGLWYRDNRYVGKLSENGKKIFWSRGNGWVFAAFARIIEELPDSYENKSYFTDVFCEMAQALKNSQCDDGAWHESLVDQKFNPDCEESGTGFFVYGLMWGINNGYLDEEEYLNCALRGWNWMTEVALSESGKIGYVQHIGAEPTKYELTANETEDYAYANFVFAASEIAKYLGGMQGDVVPYLEKKLLGNIEVYKKNSLYAIKQGEIVTGDMPMLTEAGIYNEGEYVALDNYVPAGMYVYESGDICVISEFITPFNKTEANLVTMLSDILTTGQFPERPYSDPDRFETKEGSYTWGKITVSQFSQSQNTPSDMIDGDLYTYWTARVGKESNPEWATFDLMGEYEISQIGIAFSKGSDRTTSFSVSVSLDGESYTEVVPRRESSGETTEIEYYPFDAVNARYVRLYGYGNSEESVKWWFSPTEVQIYSAEGERIFGTESMGEAVEIAPENVTASHIPEDFNPPEHMVDGSISTRWAVDYKTGQDAPYATFDLTEEYALDKIGIAFNRGDERIYYFAVGVSTDGINYTTVLPQRGSIGGTLGMSYYDLGGVDARYVRLYGYGNNVNNWFNPAEVKFYPLGNE